MRTGIEKNKNAITLPTKRNKNTKKLFCRFATINYKYVWKFLLILFLGTANVCKSQQKFYVYDTTHIQFGRGYIWLKLNSDFQKGSYEIYYDSTFQTILERGQYYHGKKMGKIITYYPNRSICYIMSYDSIGLKGRAVFEKYYIDSARKKILLREIYENSSLTKNIVDSTYDMDFDPQNKIIENDQELLRLYNNKYFCVSYFNDKKRYRSCNYINNAPFATVVSLGRNSFREISFYKSSLIESIRNYYDDDLHGYQVDYYPNGQKKMESCYHNQYAKGVEVESLMNMDCKLCRESMFSGLVICDDTIPTNGSIFYCDILENWWYENGSIEKEWTKNCKDGIISYVCKYYKPNGKLSFVGNYSQYYKKNGLHIYYNEDGTKQSEKLFDNDILIKHIKY